MHRRVSTDPSQSGPSLRAHPRMAEPAETYPGTDRYAPCPCNSGRKIQVLLRREGPLILGRAPPDRCNRKHDGIRPSNFVCPNQDIGHG